METGTIKGTDIISVDIDFSTATDASQKSTTVNGYWAVVVGSRAINKYGAVYSNNKGELYAIDAGRTASVTTVYATPQSANFYGGVASCKIYLTKG